MYVEHSKTAMHGTGERLYFAPVDEINKLTGFRTTTVWSMDQMEMAKQVGSIKILQQEACLIDTLFVDFDDAERDAMQFLKWVKDNHFHYEMYDSGGRSQHFHIPILPIHSVNAPYSTKNFMQTYCSNLRYDSSIYQYASLFRLPGTEHHKTGKKKVLLESGGIDLLEIDIVEPKRFDNLRLDAIDDYHLSMNRYINLLGASPGEGGRSMALWAIAKSFNDCGLDEKTITVLLERLNNSWGQDSKDSESLRRQLRGAMK